MGTIAFDRGEMTIYKPPQPLEVKNVQVENRSMGVKEVVEINKTDIEGTDGPAGENENEDASERDAASDGNKKAAKITGDTQDEGKEGEEGMSNRIV